MSLKDKRVFPRPFGSIKTPLGSEYNGPESGLTLLQYYSGLAMIGILSRVNGSCEDVAEGAIAQAEKMIEKLEEMIAKKK